MFSLPAEHGEERLGTVGSNGRRPVWSLPGEAVDMGGEIGEAFSWHLGPTMDLLQQGGLVVSSHKRRKLLKSGAQVGFRHVFGARQT